MQCIRHSLAHTTSQLPPPARRDEIRDARVQAVVSEARRISTWPPYSPCKLQIPRPTSNCIKHISHGHDGWFARVVLTVIADTALLLDGHRQTNLDVRYWFLAGVSRF